MTEPSSQNQTEALVPGYIIKNLIGKGSIGSVYEAEDPGGRKVALKIMAPTPFIDAKALESIIIGTSIIRKLMDKAKIVRIFDSGSTGRLFYISMELFTNGTLEKIIFNRKEHGHNFILRTASSIADTLACVHSAGILHGDLKPSNVLLSDDDTPYLNDFYQAAGSSSPLRGVVPFLEGTPKYMSPEQAAGKFLTLSSDIYSFGVLFYELLAGSLPYEGSKTHSVNDLVATIIKNEIIPLSRTGMTISRKLDAIVMKLLKNDPAERYSSMALAAEDIRACMKNKDISIPYRKSFLEKIEGIFKPDSRRQKA